MFVLSVCVCVWEAGTQIFGDIFSAVVLFCDTGVVTGEGQSVYVVSFT